MDWTARFVLLGASFNGHFPRPTISGALLHLLMATGLGVVFGAILPYSRSRGLTLLFAVGYALLVMVITTVGVLPLANPLLRREVQPMAGFWLMEHLLYGISLASVPAHRTRFSDPI